ncbi:MAG: hypothetical protein HBSAPP03_22760 [Phycisphaerae bacterium]|nr:MAG: hypothetical protein HBSAPP03_22760 [Phycisphaerae bacterium]
MNRTSAAVLAALALIPAAQAQVAVLVTDRANDSIWLLTDTNGNGMIDEPGEVRLFFSGANAAGTPATLNPNTIAARADGYVVVGDQDVGFIASLYDANCDGDAQDAGESRVIAGAGNAAGVSFAFPTGAAFDSAGRLHIVNAGNAFGNDVIFRLVDLNADGDMMDAGEITEYVGVPFFGPGNGPYSPQEILFDPEDGLYLRNSSANLHGVFQFHDVNGNGRADDPGESSLFFGAGNLSGITLSAGFAIEISPDFSYGYMHQLATGSADQIIRLENLNDDEDMQDAGEAQVAFSTTEAGFTSVDILALPDSTVLFSDNSGLRIIALRDLDGDGLFLAANERTTWFANTSGLLGAVRNLSLYRPPTCGPTCDGDVNCDGAVNGVDVEIQEQAVGGDLADYCLPDADFNQDGAVNGTDVEAVELVVGGGPCP